MKLLHLKVTSEEGTHILLTEMESEFLIPVDLRHIHAFSVIVSVSFFPQKAWSNPAGPSPAKGNQKQVGLSSGSGAPPPEAVRWKGAAFPQKTAQSNPEPERPREQDG